MAVKQTDCDCSGGRDCDEAACVLGVNNQHPSEVMGNRRAGGMEGGRKGGPCVRVPACVWVWGRWVRGSGTLPPGTLHSVKLHG